MVVYNKRVLGALVLVISGVVAAGSFLLVPCVLMVGPRGAVVDVPAVPLVKVGIVASHAVVSNAEQFDGIAVVGQALLCSRNGRRLHKALRGLLRAHRRCRENRRPCCRRRLGRRARY